MSAIPKEFRSKAAALSAEATRPYPSSRKIYVDGVDGSFGVGMREVRQMSTTSTGEGRRSKTESLTYRTLAPANVLREMRPGHGLLVYGHLPPARLTLRLAQPLISRSHPARYRSLAQLRPMVGQATLATR